MYDDEQDMKDKMYMNDLARTSKVNIMGKEPNRQKGCEKREAKMGATLFSIVSSLQIHLNLRPHAGQLLSPTYIYLNPFPCIMLLKVLLILDMWDEDVGIRKVLPLLVLVVLLA